MPLRMEGALFLLQQEAPAAIHPRSLRSQLLLKYRIYLQPLSCWSSLRRTITANFCIGVACWVSVFALCIVPAHAQAHGGLGECAINPADYVRTLFPHTHDCPLAVPRKQTPSLQEPSIVMHAGTNVMHAGTNLSLCSRRHKKKGWTPNAPKAKNQTKATPKATPPH